jgi:hypothetical protein
MMDHQLTHDHVHRHADSVVRGDMAAAFADMTASLQAEMAAAPAPADAPSFTAADVLSLDVGEDESQAVIRYSNDGTAMTVRSHWRDEGGRPVIVKVEMLD